MVATVFVMTRKTNPHGGAIFKLAYAEFHRIAPDQVILYNLSRKGASSDYVARALITQAQEVWPDLVISSLLPKNRTEFFPEKLNQPSVNRSWEFGNEIIRILNLPETEEQLASIPPHISPEHWAMLLEAARGYYSYYTPVQGFYNQIKNLLLIQNYFRDIGSQCLFWSRENAGLEASRNFRRWPDSIIQFLDALDSSDFCVLEESTHEPEKPDGTSSTIPGSMKQRSRHQGEIASQLLAFYRKQVGSRVYSRYWSRD